MSEEKIYKIYKIKDKDNDDMIFYCYSKDGSQKVIYGFKYYYKKYCLDKENNFKNTVYDLFDKYGTENLSIITLDECKKDELKQKFIDYMNNDVNCINKRHMTKDKIKNYRRLYYEKNNEKKKEYNRSYYEKNKEKALEYYQKVKNKVYEKSLCECGKYVMFNKKSCRLIHINSNHH